MPHIAYQTRCHLCGVKLHAVDDYGDYAKWIVEDGRRRRKSDDRWFDPDWILDRHVRRTHR